MYSIKATDYALLEYANGRLYFIIEVRDVKNGRAEGSR